MDVKSVFLNGNLEEEVYIEQPKGFQLTDKGDYVCNLNKSLYGLKQEPNLMVCKTRFLLTSTRL